MMGKAQASAEYKIKGAFLFNFLKLVEWPANAFTSPATPLVVGLVGKDPFAGEFEEAVRNKEVGGRSVEVVRIYAADTVTRCHALFFPKEERRRASDFLQEAGNRPILSVGDELGDFAQRGGVINLYKETDKVRFEVNVEAAKKAGLKIHSTLLNLARIIQSSQ